MKLKYREEFRSGVKHGILQLIDDADRQPQLHISHGQVGNYEAGPLSSDINIIPNMILISASLDCFDKMLKCMADAGIVP